MQIPEKLRARLKKLGIDESIYEMRSRKCVLSRAAGERVPWCDDAHYVDENYDGALKFDPVSLVPCLALEPNNDDKILDMCAAPGTKTFILSFLAPKAKITANDINPRRVMRLRANAIKYGMNCEITNVSGRLLTGSYDKILVDAPCSGEGMINKKDKLFRHWSEKRIKFLAKKQKKLIKHAFALLKERGILVYSTCTFSPEENEGAVDFLLKKNKNAVIEEINVPVKHASGVTTWDKSYDGRVASCARIYPQHNGTGGFFVAKIRKTSSK
ncbi:MAG: RsmB/NOP family class I SAM-dependent RNA methyltransferase [Candidatus Aenigmarchaeota archaeon]|nr:RsmB/NOP family class I SAM-dependent RNA methyltransferase [Candidatus Aenigmarchaeota archaeon]